MKFIVFFLTWVVVFTTMENYFNIENNIAYAVVGYLFSIYDMILDYFFDKPY